MINWKTNAEKPGEGENRQIVIVRDVPRFGAAGTTDYEAIAEGWQYVDRWCYLSELVADAMGESSKAAEFVSFSNEAATRDTPKHLQEIRSATPGLQPFADRAAAESRPVEFWTLGGYTPVKVMLIAYPQLRNAGSPDSPITNTGPQDL